MLTVLFNIVGLGRWWREFRKKRAKSIEISPRLTEVEAARRVG